MTMEEDRGPRPARFESSHGKCPYDVTFAEVGKRRLASNKPAERTSKKVGRRE